MASTQEHIDAYKQIRSQQNTERKKVREECLESVSDLCSTLLHDVRSGVAAIYTNQKKIKDATIELQQASARFDEKIARWIKKYNALNGSLRGLGDIRNWANAMKGDLVQISDDLEQIVEFKKTQMQNIKEQKSKQKKEIIAPR